jgi:hypothetical protein
MQEKGRELVDEVGQKQLLAGNFLFPVEFHQHGVGGHAGDEGGHEGGAAAVAETTEPEHRTRGNRQGPRPAQRFDHLPRHEAHQDEPQQTQQGTDKAPARRGPRQRLQAINTGGQHGQGHAQRHRKRPIRVLSLLACHWNWISWR